MAKIFDPTEIIDEIKERKKNKDNSVFLLSTFEDEYKIYIKTLNSQVFFPNGYRIVAVKENRNKDEVLQDFKKLEYKVLESNEEKVIWLQKNITETQRRDILISTEEKSVSVENNYYNKTGTLLKRTGDIPAKEFELITELVDLL